jgi:uncharacterized protein involved in exopolysaccharide biosynthesis
VAAAPILPRIIQASYDATAHLLVVSEAVKDTSAVSVDLPSIAKSSEVVGRVKRKLNLDDDVDALRKHIKAKVLPRSSVLEITYRDTDKIRAARITNAIADETSTYYHEIATGRYDDVTLKMSKTIAQLRSKIDDANARLQNASVNNPYADSDKASDNMTTQVASLHALRDQAFADLIADSAAYSALKAQGPKIAGIVEHEILAHDPAYSDMEAQVAADEALLATQRATYTDTNPAVVSQAEKVALERKQLNDARAGALRSRTASSPSYAQNVLDQRTAAGKAAGDRARVQALDAQIAVAEQQIRATFGPGSPVQALRAERDAAQQQYLALTQRLSAAQADAAQAASLGTLVVVDRAIPNASRWQLLFEYFPLIYALVVCALAIAAAYAVENVDRRFWDSKDLEDLYGQPVFEIGKLE